MKHLICIVILLVFVLLTSYITISYEPSSYTMKTFIIEDNKENTETNYKNLNTFIIEQKPSGKSMLINAYKQTQTARQRNLKYQQMDEEIEKCIRKITKNWGRVYYKESYEKVYDDNEKEWLTTNLFYEREREFYGYDKEEDWGLYWRLRNRALNGEKIC